MCHASVAAAVCDPRYLAAANKIVSELSGAICWVCREGSYGTSSSQAAVMSSLTLHHALILPLLMSDGQLEGLCFYHCARFELLEKKNTRAGGQNFYPMQLSPEQPLFVCLPGATAGGGWGVGLTSELPIHSGFLKTTLPLPYDRQ